MASIYQMPAEWKPHAGTLMEWPVSVAVWGEGLAEARLAFAETAKAIAKFEPVTMLANPALAEDAACLCGDTVKVLEMEHDDCWMRDNGPIFVHRLDTRQMVALDWEFNAWGNKYPAYALDNTVPRRLCWEMDFLRISIPMILEGGSVHSNGAGTLLTTRECLLNPNRNPELTQKDIEKRLRLYLGAQRIVWLPTGLHLDETDGHVDNLCCFTNEGTVLLSWTDDPENPNFNRVHDAYEELAAANLKVIKLPLPPTVLHKGNPLTLSYANFAYANGGIVMPAFGGVCEESDLQAKAIVQGLFPEREILTPQTLAIVRGGGNIHCITCPIPQ
ncbi:agmatine deiminase family protein [Oscillospiraceae bacterium MB08-C2-2]|nr:agmatine deiminase family protein [Oscillospiraceae bacterium MB08-C2-2]